MQSIVQRLGHVPFAPYTGERVYMRPFTQRAGLPDDLRHWQPTVDAMLAQVDAPGPIYLMIDQGLVRAGTTHRRPGLHIDGYWIPELQAHGGGHRGSRHIGCWKTGGWSHADYREAEGIILASSVTAARAFAGEFHGEVGEGGNCSHINAGGLLEVPLIAGHAYAGNVTMLHESLPVAADCLRTVVRLNVPGWTPQ